MTVLDPSTVANASLSGNGLVLTNTSVASNNCGARCNASEAKTSGKFYFEATITDFTGGATNGVAIAPSSTTLAQINSASGQFSSVHFVDGGVVSNGSAGAFIGARADGDVIGIAVDLDNRKFWARVAPSGNWNGNASFNPATNTGGVAIVPAGAVGPVVNFGSSGLALTNITTVNFGGSSFTGVAPAGFNAGWQVIVVTPPPPSNNYAGGASRGRMIRKFRKREDEDLAPTPLAPAPPDLKPPPLSPAPPDLKPPPPGLMAGIPMITAQLPPALPLDEDEEEIALLLELLS